MFAVEAMLQFMYTSDYDASCSADNSASPMVSSVKVYSIADKYDVPALKSQAKEKFKTAVETCWTMDDFPYAIAEVYNSTTSIDRGLRNVVVDIASKHVNQLLSKQAFSDVLGEVVGFASDIAQQLANSQEKIRKRLRKYKCPHCEKQWEAVLSSENTYRCIHCGNSRSDWTSHTVK